MRASSGRRRSNPSRMTSAPGVTGNGRSYVASGRATALSFGCGTGRTPHEQPGYRGPGKLIINILDNFHRNAPRCRPLRRHWTTMRSSVAEGPTAATRISPCASAPTAGASTSSNTRSNTIYLDPEDLGPARWVSTSTCRRSPARDAIPYGLPEPGSARRPRRACRSAGPNWQQAGGGGSRLARGETEPDPALRQIRSDTAIVARISCGLRNGIAA